MYHAREHVNTRSISEHAQISGTRVRQMLVNDAYIHTYPQLFCAGAVVMINVGLAQALPNNSI